MLTRLITASILIPFAIVVILWLPFNIFSVVMLVILLIAAIEVGSLGGLHNRFFLLLYAVSTASSAVLLEMLSSNQVSEILRILGGALWIIISLLMLLWKKPIQPKKGISPFVLFSNYILLVIAWLSMMKLYTIDINGPYLLLALFVLIWLADSSAFFVGRFFGNRKLAPIISPNKTWEGVFGSLVAALIFSLIFYNLNLLQTSFLWLCFVFITVTICSIGGDLFESFIKRQRNVKDSGTILPGHGGIMDRIDSAIAALPVFASGLVLLEYLP
tara:strand:- start:429 stop:1247 length:819 start_codon:yes stop_codon:yes gene_type:complete